MPTAKDKKTGFQVGDIVYHGTGGEKKPGIVISVDIVEVDWGPETGVSDHHEGTLSTTYVPDYGDTK